jgi:flagellar hook-associated protein 3 FlgL
MRITQGIMTQQLLTDIQNNYQRLATLQNEVATGKRINKASDDPIGAGFVMRYKSNLAYYQQYSDNAGAAESYLNTLDSTMDQAVQIMQQARTYAVQGSNGTLQDTDRQKIAAAVDQLYEQLVNVGNAQYQDNYLFNGQMTKTAPYSMANAMAESTDGGAILYDIGDETPLAVNVTGTRFFGDADTNDVSTPQGVAIDPSDNAFSLLKQLKTALESGTSQDVGNLLSKFDSRLEKMLQARAEVGAKTNRVKMTSSRLDDLIQNTETLLSNTEDADMTKLIVDLKAAENVHQASLQVGARIITPTLLDFLK